MNIDIESFENDSSFFKRKSLISLKLDVLAFKCTIEGTIEDWRDLLRRGREESEVTSEGEPGPGGGWSSAESDRCQVVTTIMSGDTGRHEL